MKTTKDLMVPFAKHVMRAPVAIAPERKDELWEDVVRRHQWTFELKDGPAQYFVAPEHHAVKATHAGLAVLWCLAFVAYHTMDIAGAAQRTCTSAALQ